MKAGLFPLVWVVSAAKLQPQFSSPALQSLHGRPGRSGSIISTLPAFSLPLSFSLVPTSPMMKHMHSAHALYHGYACSESTSASLRPKVEDDRRSFSSKKQNADLAHKKIKRKQQDTDVSRLHAYTERCVFDVLYLVFFFVFDASIARTIVREIMSFFI